MAMLGSSRRAFMTGAAGGMAGATTVGLARASAAAPVAPIPGGPGARVTIDGVEHGQPSSVEFGAWWNLSLASLVRRAHHVVVEAEAEIELRSSLDLTSIRTAPRIDMTRARFRARLPGGVALDLTDSSGIRMQGPALLLGSEVEGETPDVGMLLSRAIERNSRSAGKHRFEGLTVDGSWKRAAIYCVSSENNTFFGPRVDNGAAGAEASLYLAHRNYLGIQSAHGLTPGSTESSTAFQMYAGMCQARAAMATVVVDGFDRAMLDSPTLSSASAPYLLITTEHNGVTGPVVRDAICLGAFGARPDVGFLFTGRFNNGIIGTRLSSQLTAVNSYIAQVDRCDLTRCDVDWFDLAREPPAGDETGLLRHPGARFTACRFRNRAGDLTL
jgi:hypothetical protein